MRKEILIAVCLGSVLGVILALLLWRASKTNSAKPSTNSPFVTTATSTPTATPTTSKDFSVLSPQEGSITVSESIQVKGLAPTAKYVLISTPNEDRLVTVAPNGEYLSPITLDPAHNPISVTALYTDNSLKSITRTVVYSSEFEKFLTTAPSATASPTPKPSATNGASGNPIAFIGTVTDILEAGVQLKSETGEILQVSLNKAEIEVAKLSTTKEIKFGDIAIGDSLIAMGFATGKETMSAKRLVVITTSTLAKRDVKVVEFVKATGATMTVVQDGVQSVVAVPKNANAPKLTTLTAGVTLLVSGVEDKEGDLTARVVFVVESTPVPSPTPTSTPTPKPTKSSNLD